MGRRILIVDDDFPLCEVLYDRLKAVGYDILIAHDGRSALAIVALEHRKEVIDGIILDLNLPGLDGLAVLRELRALSSTIPVIILSATGKEQLFSEALRSGAQDYLVKPFDLKVLVEKCTSSFIATIASERSPASLIRAGGGSGYMAVKFAAA